MLENAAFANGIPCSMCPLGGNTVPSEGNGFTQVYVGSGDSSFVGASNAPCEPIAVIHAGVLPLFSIRHMI